MVKRIAVVHGERYERLARAYREKLVKELGLLAKPV